MQLELARSMKGLRLSGHPSPCYLGYSLRVRQGYTVWGRYGSVFYSAPLDSSTLHADLRVGSYRSDQTVDGRLESREDDVEWLDLSEGPEDFDPFTLRYCFWRLTAARHREALRDYYDKKKISLDEQLVVGAPSLRRVDPTRLSTPIRKLKGSRAAAEDFVRAASQHFVRYPRLEDPYVQLKELVQTRIVVNSEGAQGIAQERYFELVVSASMLAEDGVRQYAARTFFVRRLDELPGLDAIATLVDEVNEDLEDLVRAEPMEPYAGPALFGGEAAGVLFHEAIGHRLEGERLLSRSEGHTFAKKVGKRILPAGIDIVDDPSLERFDGRTLYGTFAFDDEGTPAQRVQLVEDGILRRFLTSRNGIPGQKGSNGHARHSKGRELMARMGNLIVTAREALSQSELVERWMAEVERREQPFGLLVTNAESGETTTSSDAYEFQAFQVDPTKVYLVDAATGNRRRVRDVSFVGTPLTAIHGVMALGDDMTVDNSYCGAESGSVPVGTVAPSTLLREIEAQRSTSARQQPPILNLPPRR
ncbi:MAG: TldD/PmbA family protein, partial [Planctomycetes bacterium]|nr:TldD/PmbA family protein [Planctomycetota bacterium]